MNYQGHNILQRPDSPDTYVLQSDLVLEWLDSSATLMIPISRRGNFTNVTQYMLSIHLVYQWSRGAPDWILQVYNADTDVLLYQQTEGLDSYAKTASTLNEQIIIPTRNLRFVALRQDDTVEELTVFSGSFYKIEKFS